MTERTSHVSRFVVGAAILSVLYLVAVVALGITALLIMYPIIIPVLVGCVVLAYGSGYVYERWEA